VRAILDAYLASSDESFDVAAYGAELSADDERRRYVLKTLLRRDGLALGAYQAWFGSRADDDFPELAALVAGGLAQRRGDRVALTDDGLALSDTIGPMFYSSDVRGRMAAFDLR
jgi:oxygen-independent coproporphyrinogen-3 oxidase